MRCAGTCSIADRRTLAGGGDGGEPRAVPSDFREAPQPEVPRTPTLYEGGRIGAFSDVAGEPRSRGSRYCHTSYNARCPRSRGERKVDGDKSAPSREEQAKKAERRKILERLNSMDTGAHHHDRE